METEMSVTQVGMDIHRKFSKVAAWRKARGLTKSNRTDADLLSELPAERERWWEVWLAPPTVRDQREWLRYRMTSWLPTTARCRTAPGRRSRAICNGWIICGGKRDKNRGYIAVARELCRMVYVCWADVNTEYRI